MKNKLTLRESILYNYAQSLGAAIRNGMDPNDPDQVYYRDEVAPERVRECYRYILKHDIDPQLGIEIMNQAVNNQIEWLTCGFIDALRESIQKK